MYNFCKGYAFSFSSFIPKEGFYREGLTRPPNCVTFFSVNANKNFFCKYVCASNTGCDLFKALCQTTIKDRATCPNGG
jgi:hypothetical protein